MFNKIKEDYYNKKAEEHMKKYNEYFGFIGCYAKPQDNLEMLDLARGELYKWAYNRRIAINTIKNKSVRNDLEERFYMVLDALQKSNTNKERLIRGLEVEYDIDGQRIK